MKLRAHIYIIGRVQGVFFRSKTCREARKYNLTGWVKNLANGRVEAVFEGEEEDVQRLIAFCGKGPSGASVAKTEVVLQNYTGEFTDFKITW